MIQSHDNVYKITVGKLYGNGIKMQISKQHPGFARASSTEVYEHRQSEVSTAHRIAPLRRPGRRVVHLATKIVSKGLKKELPIHRPERSTCSELNSRHIVKFCSDVVNFSALKC